MAKPIVLNFELWNRQLVALNSPANEWLYGGAAGGGKSHLERVASIVWCMDIPGLQYYLFRRSYSDLQKSYVEGPTGYNAMLGELIVNGSVESVAKEIRFPNGSKIYLCHCQHDKDVFNFQSFEFHVLDLAEAGQFTPFMINFLRSRVRMPEEFRQKLPKKYLIPREFWRERGKPEWQFPRVVMTCNPVGVGKAYLKKNFVDGHKPDMVWRASDQDGGMLRQFIPAKLTDNPSLDPVSYAASLQGIGSKGYVEALLEGRWDATVGAFFPQIDKALHLIKPFMIPEHWPKFFAYDHGACGGGHPFSAGWYTVADGSMPVFSAYTQEPILCQRGALICYRRWNGQGLPKMTVVEIAEGILEREYEQVLYRVVGGDIVEQRGMGEKDNNTGKARSESVFTLFAKHGIKFILADRRRHQGAAQVDYRLTGENGAPLSFWFEECEGDLDQFSNLQHDLHDPNDIAKAEDDDYDRHRYACMSRAEPKEEVIQKSTDYRNLRLFITPTQILANMKKNKKSGYVTRG